MSASETTQTYTGPALLSAGFRVFFPAAALWAVISVALWVAILTGLMDINSRFDPATWHAHAFLYGYLSAVLSGFVLTAMPNWTGRAPLTGAPLLGLFALWLVARGAHLVSSSIAPLPLVLIDLSLPLLLIIYALREIAAAKHWRALPVIVLISIFAASDVVFHLEAERAGYAAQSLGVRIGLATIVMLIALVGGRIVPTFTLNWLKKAGADSLPPPAMQRFDLLALAVLAAALLSWVIAPYAVVTVVLLIVAGLGHLARLARWQGYRVLGEPLMWVLHVGYLWLPLGAWAMALSVLAPDSITPAAAQHVWMAGAIGLMTLAVMTRAVLGHTGRPLHAGTGTVTIYGLVIFSVLSRVSAGLFPDIESALISASGMAWLAAFALFFVLYTPACLSRRQPE